ncbi:MAG: hypothetical protein HY900_09860 [Deltaproteobacteria bacterium]|nr:hypothetical protein [Deltaproteobacteria bacterium]
MLSGTTGGLCARVAGALLGFVLFFSWGCAGSPAIKSFLRKDVDLTYVRTVGVLPFELQGGSSGIAEQAREITITQVLGTGVFDVVDKGRVDSALKEEGIEKTQTVDPAAMKRLGQRLKVQAFLLGSVDQAGDIRAGASVYPEVTLTLRLIDSEAGVLLWQASGRGTGYSLTDRLFGTGSKNSFQVTLDLLARLFSTLRAPARAPAQAPAQ